MTYQTNTQTEPSLGELFTTLTNQASLLFRQEVDLAQAEMMRKTTRAGKNVAVIGVGAMAGMGAFNALLAATILGLAQLMDAWLAALIVASVLALVAIALVRFGIEKLKAIDPAPRRTIETMRENKEWLTQQI